MSDLIVRGLVKLADALIHASSDLYYRHETEQLAAALRADGFTGAELQPGWDLPVLMGVWAGRAVEVHVKQHLLRRSIEIWVRGALPGVSARPFDAIAMLDQRVVTGHAALDERLSISGEAFGVLRALHPAARAALLALAEQGWVVEKGDAVLTLPWSEAAALPVTGLKAAITAFVSAVDHAPADLSARVAQETCAPLRLRLLAELARFGPAYVRRNLGAAVVESDHGPTAALAAALLGDGAGWERAGEAARTEALALAPEQAVALMRSRGDEAGLIAALAQLPEEHAPGVIAALGAVGTREAVPHLSPIAERTVLSRDLSAQASAAITRIQARLEGAQRGQVALVEAGPEAGALAVVEGGGVALAEREAQKTV